MEGRVVFDILFDHYIIDGWIMCYTKSYYDNGDQSLHGCGMWSM